MLVAALSSVFRVPIDRFDCRVDDDTLFVGDDEPRGIDPYELAICEVDDVIGVLDERWNVAREIVAIGTNAQYSGDSFRVAYTASSPVKTAATA